MQAVINIFKSLLGVAVLVGFGYGIYYFVTQGRTSPEIHKIQSALRIGRTIGQVELELGTPHMEFNRSQRTQLEEVLKEETDRYASDQRIRDELSGYQDVRVYSYQSGPARRVIAAYAGVGKDGQPLIGWIIFPREGKPIFGRSKPNTP